MRTQRTHRILALSLSLAVTLTLAACGDDGEAPSATSTPGTTAPVATPDTTTPDTTVPTGIDHPTGADEVVVSIGYEGGFVPADYAFRGPPDVAARW